MGSLLSPRCRHESEPSSRSNPTHYPRLEPLGSITGGLTLGEKSRRRTEEGEKRKEKKTTGSGSRAQILDETAVLKTGAGTPPRREPAAERSLLFGVLQAQRLFSHVLTGNEPGGKRMQGLTSAL